MVRNKLSSQNWQLFLSLLMVMTTGFQMLSAQLISNVPRRDQAAQARSEEELDSYVGLVVATDPHQVLEQAGLFLDRYPKSELLRKVYDFQFHAFYQLNDLPGVISSGEKILKVDPKDIDTLLTMATIIANKPPKGEQSADLLQRADGYCHQVLQNVGMSKAPRTMTVEAADAEKTSIRYKAHQTLGVIAVEQGRPQTAIAEFRTAITLAPVRDGSDFFRLGVALKSVGAHDEANKAFRDASALGPDSVRRLASVELAKP